MKPLPSPPAQSSSASSVPKLVLGEDHEKYFQEKRLKTYSKAKAKEDKSGVTFHVLVALREQAHLSIVWTGSAPVIVRGHVFGLF